MLAKKIDLYEVKSKLIRVGPKYDGGYVLPKKVLSESDALISLGVGFDLRFEREFTKRTRGHVCLVDRNIDITNYFNSELKGIRTFLRAISNFFYLKKHSKFLKINKYISINKNEEDFSFIELVEILKSKRSSILKVDIERYEYAMFSNENISRLNGIPLSCIIIEFHGLKRYHNDLLRIIKNFQKLNLYLVHVHGNNYTPYYEDLGMYNCSEFTFVHEKYCFPTTIINKKLPIPLLDYPSDKNGSDIDYVL